MKTEEPTPRRLRRARQEGDAPISHPLTQALGLLVAVLLVPTGLAACAERAAGLLRAALAGTPVTAPERTLAVEVLALSAPLLLAVAGAVTLAGLWQTQGVVSAARLTPRFERLDPVAGTQALFRPERLFSVLRALVTAGAAALLAFWLFRRHAPDVVATGGSAELVAPLTLELGRTLGIGVALIGVALALLDLALVHRGWRQRNRMTKDEVRREFREAEGDPEMKAKRRRAHQEALAGSIVNAVREATVVIVNPTHLASALRYVENEGEAPRLVAQGEGELARHIVEAARAYGIPCIRDVPVARALRELELGDEIPEALYEAVAEILREIAAGEPASGDAESVP
jgi:flagellar biosynthesis protein FlhB